MGIASTYLWPAQGSATFMGELEPNVEPKMAFLLPGRYNIVVSYYHQWLGILRLYTYKYLSQFVPI